MNSTSRDGILRHFAFALFLAIIFYIAFFAWIQHRRLGRGPWNITFQTDSAGMPSLAITQSNLHISEVIRFPAQKIQPANMSQPIHFDQAVSTLPFGKIIFQDPTFLPGTVTMTVFGHQMELLPRILKVDTREYPWGSQPRLNLP